MKYLQLLVLLYLLAASVLTLTHASNSSGNPSIKDFPVDPFIGTGGQGYGLGQNPPGAQVPFGMARVSPDTSNIFKINLKFTHFGGYFYLDPYINTFSHTHLVGAGTSDYGTLGIMPITLRKNADIQKSLNKMLVNKRWGYRSRYSHDDEQAEPGYQRVYLQTYKIMAELTATQNAGVHKYVWNQQNDKKVILFDTSQTLQVDACSNSEVRVYPQSGEITGYIYFNGSLSGRQQGGMKMYFFMKTLGQKWLKYGVWNANGTILNVDHAQGCNTGAFVEVENQTATVHVGISFISVEQAKRNLEVQTNFTSFEDVKRNTQQKWVDELSLIKVEGKNEDDKKIFYTACYHAFASPTTWTEADGKYMGFDRNVRDTPSHMKNVYTDLSIWDTHRTQFPWLLLINPSLMRDISNSILLMYQQTGGLPRWPIGYVQSGCMFGSYGDTVLADQITKHEYTNDTFNTTLAMDACRFVSNNVQSHDSRQNPSTYLKYKYVPYDNPYRGAPDTLAQSQEDWCIGNIAKELGLEEDAKEYYRRSMFYKNVWSDEQKLFCPRKLNGEFDCPNFFMKHQPFDQRYIEGDAFHYFTYVPHDPEGLVELFGSREKLVKALEAFFDNSKLFRFHILPNPWQWHGNEHNLFAAFQFAQIGRPDLTQKYVRWILDNEYTSGPDGISGNDDYGTMSAWYTFAAAGFYPLSGSPQYILTSPLFDRITIKRRMIDGSNCTIEVIAHDTSKTNIYIKEVKLNGQKLESYPFIDHIKHLKCQNGISTITLEYFMTSVASQN